MSIQSCGHCGEKFDRGKGKQGFCSLRCRFYARVRIAGENDCWLWLGAVKTNKQLAYGQIRADGKSYRAHRLAYELERGPIPGGAVVCHRCDNPSCVNAAHLFLGTQKDNMLDMLAKGRGAFRLLTDTERLRFIELHAAGWSKRRLRAHFRIEKRDLNRILAGETMVYRRPHLADLSA